MSLPYTDNITMISAVGQTTTSDAYDISKRQQVTFQFISAGGTSVYTIDVSNDGTNWITGVAFLDAKATASTTLVVSKSVASTTEGAYLKTGFRFVRVVATWTSGTATAIMEAAG